MFLKLLCPRQGRNQAGLIILADIKSPHPPFIKGVAFDGYVYLVPYVEEPDHYFLKTVIPSGKATRGYLLRSNSDEKT